MLVATSGDTGSAVAQAFFGVEGTRVVVLFPEAGCDARPGGAVHDARRQRHGGRRQRHVRRLSAAREGGVCRRRLRARARLTSANSINIGRLVPQIFYYAHAALQSTRRIVVSVPSGNFGNLTAGLMAGRLDAPLRHFVAATTINDTVPRYLESGRYEPRPSVTTLANAMDVGDPSNVERMRWLFDDDLDRCATSHRIGAYRLRGSRSNSRAVEHSKLSRRSAHRDRCSRIAGHRNDGRQSSAVPCHRAPGKVPRDGRAGHRPVDSAAAALAEAMARPRRVEQISPKLAELREILISV